MVGYAQSVVSEELKKLEDLPEQTQGGPTGHSRVVRKRGPLVLLEKRRKKKF